jgi:hypothetical protein
VEVDSDGDDGFAVGDDCQSVAFVVDGGRDAMLRSKLGLRLKRVTGLLRQTYRRYGPQDIFCCPVTCYFVHQNYTFPTSPCSNIREKKANHLTVLPSNIQVIVRIFFVQVIEFRIVFVHVNLRPWLGMLL